MTTLTTVVLLIVSLLAAVMDTSELTLSLVTLGMSIAMTATRRWMMIAVTIVIQTVFHPA